MPVKIVRTPGAAAYCGLKESTFEKFRIRGEGPRFIRLGRRAVGYDLADLEKWLDERRFLSTSENDYSANHKNGGGHGT